MLIDDDLRGRVQRLLNGTHLVHDLDRLFLAIRDRNHNRESVREVGDFIAHRSERQKGLVTQTGRDVFTSVDVWSLPLRGRKPTIKDIARAAWANFRLASDSQLEESCGFERGTVKGKLQSGLHKLECGGTLTRQELCVTQYLGNRFIWKPALTDAQLFEEFRQVLSLNALLADAEILRLDAIRAHIALYAICCMHGSTLLLDDGVRAELRAGFFNRERHLEVKMQIRFDDAPKPLMMPICLFLTSLHAADHCQAQLMDSVSYGQPPFAWSEPIELGSDGKLCSVR